MSPDVSQKMTRLHAWVATGGYTWPRVGAFALIRVAQIAGLLVILRLVIRWGFDA